VTAETIYALSSGSPPAAIAVVRISGPRADAALEALAGKLPPPRRARLAELSHGGERLDRALVLRFPGPDSATGEDVAELHLHGGRAVVSAVLKALSTLDGLREAQPGEFTRRAFDTGRIDLAEAEGMADLLEAETDSQRRAALALAGGALSRRVEEWQGRVMGLAAQLEAALDFSDEGEVGEGAPEGWSEALAALVSDVEALLARPPAERLRDGLRVVIAGPPNAGKSTLLNALSGREAAITSATPGTTRDLVEAPTAIAGAPFLLIDTAGLRDSADEVEAIGVDRARHSIAAADLILWLGEAQDCPDPCKAILVDAKSDLTNRPVRLEADIRLSAKTGENLGRLIELLLARSKLLMPQEGEVALNARHRAALDSAVMSLREALGEEDLLIVAELLRGARVALDAVTGRAGVEDMLDALFGRFCIGK
jgi:tRNA modification GTPase